MRCLLTIIMSTIHDGSPTTILFAKKCWRMKKEGSSLEQRGGKGLISINFYHCDPGSSNRQPFIRAHQGCMEILCTGIASKAIKHKTDMATAVITCQDWAHRESLKNPIKRIFFFKFKTSVRADFFLEIWNEHFNEYYAHKNTSTICSTGGFDAISEDPFIAEKSVEDEAATTSPADNSLQTIDGDSFKEYAGNYSDDDELFEQTQPTTEPLRFDLKRK